jgi:hypothetical protein
MSMPGASSVTVCVDRNDHGDWQVALPDRREPVTCETLDDARRIAYLCAADRHPCELVVRDAYHRVLEHDYFDESTTPEHAFTRPRR